MPCVLLIFLLFASSCKPNSQLNLHFPLLNKIKSSNNLSPQEAELLQKYCQGQIEISRLKSACNLQLKKLENEQIEKEYFLKEKQKQDDQIIKLKIIIKNQNKVRSDIFEQNRQQEKMLAQKNIFLESTQNNAQKIVRNLQNLRNENRYLKTQLHDCQNRINYCESEFKGQQQLYKKQINQINQQLLQNKIEFANQFKKMERAVYENKILNQKIEELEKVLSGRNILIDEQANQIQILAEELANKSNELKKSLVRIDNLEQFCSDQANINMSANFSESNENSLLKDECTKLLEKLSILESEKEKLSKKMIETEKSCEKKIDEIMQESEQKLLNAKNKEDELVQAYQQITDILDSKENYYEKLNEQKKYLSQKTKTLKNKVKALRCENEELKTTSKETCSFALKQKDAFDHQSAQYKQKNKNLESEIQVLSDENEDQKRRLEFLEDQNSTLKKSLAKTISVFEQTQTRFEEQMARLQKNFEEQSKLYPEHNLHILQHGYSQRYQKISQNFVETHKALTQEIEILNNKLAKNQGKIKEIKRSLRMKKAENSKLKHQYANLSQKESSDKSEPSSNAQELVSNKLINLENEFKQLKKTKDHTIKKILQEQNQKNHESLRKYRSEKQLLLSRLQASASKNIEHQDKIKTLSENLHKNHSHEKILQDRLKTANDEIEIIKESLMDLHYQSEKDSAEKELLSDKLKTLEDQIKNIKFDLDRQINKSCKYKFKYKGFKQVCKEKDKTIEKTINHLDKLIKDNSNLSHALAEEIEINDKIYQDNQLLADQFNQAQNSMNNTEIITKELKDKIKNYSQITEEIKHNKNILDKDIQITTHIINMLDALPLNLIRDKKVKIPSQLIRYFKNRNIFETFIQSMTPESDSLTHLLENPAYQDSHNKIGSVDLVMMKNEEIKNSILAYKAFLVKYLHDKENLDKSVWNFYKNAMAEYFDQKALKNLNIEELKNSKNRILELLF